MKRLIYGMYSIFFTIFFISLPAYADLADTVASIRPAIVGIGTYQATRKQQLILAGTGFAVLDGRHIVTNYHVISRPLDQENEERIVVFVGHGANSKAYKVVQVRLDEVHDLALLRFDGPPLRPLKISRSDRVREGELYAFTGFPIGAVLGLYPVTHRGIISAITPFATPTSNGNQLSAFQIQQLRDTKPFMVYQLDATAYPGNSGSPLYAPDSGLVIGVLNSVLAKKTRESVLENPSAISYAIPAKFVLKLIQNK